MFGIGLGEFILMAVLAVIFLGPDKLPETLVQVAKFFKSFKRNIDDAKQAIEDDIELADLTNFQDEVKDYTAKLEDFKDDIYSPKTDASTKEAKAVKAIFDDVKKPKQDN